MRWIAIGLILSGLVLAGAGAGLRLVSSSGQAIAEVTWKPVPAGHVPAPDGEQLTRLSFPSQGDVFFVRDGASSQTLLLGPARLDWSAPPGGRGNCIILAHRDTHFRMLREVRLGDQIVLERGGKEFHYQIVTLKVISSHDDRYYQPTNGPVLTLVTCYPFFYLGRAPQRYIVRAQLLASTP
jgi:sortase A